MSHSDDIDDDAIPPSILEGLVDALLEAHRCFPKPSNEKEADALENMAWELYRYQTWRDKGLEL